MSGKKSESKALRKGQLRKAFLAEKETPQVLGGNHEPGHAVKPKGP